MDVNKVLFLSQEIAPSLPDSKLSKIGHDLPLGIQERGFEVRTFMPKYGSINERRNQLHEVIRLSGSGYDASCPHAGVFYLQR